MPLSQISKIIKIFYYYASETHRDKIYFDRLRTHLSDLKRQGSIIEWYDNAISAIGTGNNWQQIINKYVNDADIIVLLISADFLASKYYHEVEMKRIFERHKEGTARVLAVILRPTEWSNHPLDKAGFLPREGKAISLWKDKDAAFLEVVRGIRKVIEELVGQVASALPRSGSPKFPLWTVPHRHCRFFTGREDILKALHSYFFADQHTHTHIQALNGLDGIGKTQLAIEYAYRFKHEYQAVFWVRADSRDLFSADIRALADLLFLPKQDCSDDTLLFATVRNWLQHNHTWLLLLDNIDMDNFSLIDLIIPAQCAGHVLLTTHAQAIGNLAYTITVPPLTTAEGALFLLRRSTLIADQASQNETLPANYALACTIAREFDGFTLALDQAGAYIEETQSNLVAYLKLYRQRRIKLLQQRGQFSNGHPQSVTATLTLAFDKIEQINPVAMELLRLLAFLHPDAIPDEMLTPGMLEQNAVLQALIADPLALDTAIATLLNFSLICRRADTTTLSIHRIVQIVLRDTLNPRQHRQWAICVVRLMNRVFPEAIEDFTSWPACYRYLPQAQISAEYINNWHFTIHEAALLLHRLGSYCRARALYSDAETYLTAALTLREQLEGPAHIETAQSLNALALLYQQQGKYQQAENLQQRALTLYEHCLGAEHPETATMLNNLALLYKQIGKFSLVEALYLHALAIYQQANDTHHAEVATTLNNLATFYQEQGQLARAEPHYLHALAIREEVLPPGDPEIAQSLNNLGIFYQEQGKYAEAKPLLLRALQIREQTLGTEHPETAFNLNNLALLYRSQNNYQQAEILYQKAIDIFERISGPEHTNTALPMLNLGRLYYIQGNYEPVEPLYLRASAIYEKALGPHPTTAISLSFLADLYTSQEKWQQAEAFYQRALAMGQQTPGNEHPNTTIIMEKYACFLEKIGRIEEALIFRQARANSTAQHINEQCTYEPSDQTM